MSDTNQQTPAPKAKAGSNKLIIIIVVVLAVLVVGGFAMQKVTQKTSEMAGEKMAESLIESAAGGQADVDINKDGMTVKTDEGSFSTGTELPDDWPTDVPVYPGSKVTYSGTNSMETGEAGYSLMLTTSDNYQEVADYYTKELAAQGWSIASTQNITDTTVISVAKDNRSLTVAAATAEGETTISLGVGQGN